MSEWAVGADKLIKAFNTNKPDQISETEKRESIDTLVGVYTAGELPEKEWFSSIQPFSRRSKVQTPGRLGEVPKKRGNLREAFRQHDSSLLGQLLAPKLQQGNGRIFWDPVPGANEYVVEESLDSKFDSPKQVYRGPENSYTPDTAPEPTVKKLESKSIRNLLLKPPGGAQLTGHFPPFRTRWYRVKAIGVFFYSDRSNSVSFFG